MTFVLGFIGFTSFNSSNQQNKKFDEITVQRINVVEPDGKLKMVISNSDKQHPGMFNGKKMDARQRQPGMLFFNEEEDEVGGLVYAGNKKDGAGMVLSYDQYQNDQIMQMQYIHAGKNHQKYGVQLWDRSEDFSHSKLTKIADSLNNEGLSANEISKYFAKINDNKPINTSRMFTGKNFDKQVGMFLKDELGKDRIKIFVDKNNQPKFEVLDDDGNKTNVIQD